MAPGGLRAPRRAETPPISVGRSGTRTTPPCRGLSARLRLTVPAGGTRVTAPRHCCLCATERVTAAPVSQPLEHPVPTGRPTRRSRYGSAGFATSRTYPWASDGGVRERREVGHAVADRSTRHYAAPARAKARGPGRRVTVSRARLVPIAFSTASWASSSPA